MSIRHRLSGKIYLKFVPMRIRQALAVALVGTATALTGCLSRTHKVPKTRVADVVMDATLDQLLHQVDIRFDALQSLNASVEIATSEGGARKGQITQHPSFSGYIFLRKPENLRVLLRVPFVGSVALDMVSDGKNWKFWSPPKHLAMAGTSEVSDSSQHGLESLRPAVIFDSLMIRGLGPGQVVSLTQDSRVFPDEKNKKDLIEEPDYDLAILEQPHGVTAHTVRVIHVGRVTLLPYQQDIYGADGTVVTRAFYSNYQRFTDSQGTDVQFPMKIEIRRPQDQYALTITFTKLAVNQKLDDDQFDVRIPEGVTIQTMK
jgi:outer membrane lipoprotein-sorting protein